MKKFFLSLSVLLSAQWSTAGTGGVADGGGGDQYALEFIKHANAIYSLLQQTTATKEFPEIPLQSLRFAIDSTKVESQNQLVLNGAEVDAINYPSQQKILLNRARWSAYNQERSGRVFSIVLHEYLGIMRIDDTNYRISSRFQDWLEKNNFPNKPGAIHYTIMRHKFSFSGGTSEKVCEGRMSFFASYADQYSSVTCRTQSGGEPIAIDLAAGALLAKGGLGKGWDGYNKLLIHYLGMIEIVNSPATRLNKFIQASKHASSPKLSGNSHVLLVQSDYVGDRIDNCKYGKKICAKPDEPNELYYAIVEFMD